jgi:hypothetical protein
MNSNWPVAGRKLNFSNQLFYTNYWKKITDYFGSCVCLPTGVVLTVPLRQDWPDVGPTGTWGPQWRPDDRPEGTALLWVLLQAVRSTRPRTPASQQVDDLSDVDVTIQGSHTYSPVQPLEWFTPSDLVTRCTCRPRSWSTLAASMSHLSAEVFVHLGRLHVTPVGRGLRPSWPPEGHTCRPTARPGSVHRAVHRAPLVDNKGRHERASGSPNTATDGPRKTRKTLAPLGRSSARLWPQVPPVRPSGQCCWTATASEVYIGKEAIRTSLSLSLLRFSSFHSCAFVVYDLLLRFRGRDPVLGRDLLLAGEFCFAAFGVLPFFTVVLASKSVSGLPSQESGDWVL